MPAQQQRDEGDGEQQPQPGVEPEPGGEGGEGDQAPTLRAFLAGSISGLDRIPADSLRNVTIDPVNVTAPMKTPITTSALVDPEQVLGLERPGLCTARVRLDVQVAVPADQDRGQADEAVQQRE